MAADNKYSISAALSMVVANMIGVGVFSAIGFQVIPFEKGGIPDNFAILLVWLIGGLISLCGAFVYAEIATTLKQNGGEYTFLSKLYHPSLGFASGWISLIVGFSGAIASTGLAIGKYSGPALGFDPSSHIYFFGVPLTYQKIVGCFVICIISIFHLRSVKTSGLLQTILTGIKILLLTIFCLAPFFIFYRDGISFFENFSPTTSSFSIIYSLPFASALVWVMYAYSGWNSAAYIAGSIKNPNKSIPFVLIIGVLLVTFIYVLLNASFLFFCTFEQMMYQEDVGNIVSIELFGFRAGTVFAGFFSLALLSTMSAMVIAGPKVSEQVGNDFSFFTKLSKKSKGGSPVFAILLQAFISIILVLFSSFQELIVTLGITLAFFSLLTVFGVFILRKKYSVHERPVRTIGYPITPIIFISMILWMIVSFAIEDPIKIWYSFVAIVPGFIIYFLIEKNEKKQ